MYQYLSDIWFSVRYPKCWFNQVSDYLIQSTKSQTFTLCNQSEQIFRSSKFQPKARHLQFGRLQNIEDLFKQYKVGCFAVYNEYSSSMSLHLQSGWTQEAAQERAVTPAKPRWGHLSVIKFQLQLFFFAFFLVSNAFAFGFFIQTIRYWQSTPWPKSAGPIPVSEIFTADFSRYTWEQIQYYIYNPTLCTINFFSHA